MGDGICDNEGSEKIPARFITVEEAISFIGTGKAQYLLLFLTAGGYFASCSELLMSVYSQAPLADEWDITDETFAWLPFSTQLASAVGGFIFGLLSDKTGRKFPFVFSVGISGFFGLVSAFAPSFWSFILLRSIASIGISGSFAVDFVLLLEFLPMKNRGRFMIMIAIGGTLGVAYTAGLAWALIPKNLFQMFVILCAVPLLIMFIARLVFNVESPRFLLSVGKYDEAMKILRWLSKQNKREFVLKEFIITPFDLKQPSGKLSHVFTAQFMVQTIQLSMIWLLQSTGYWGMTIFFPKFLTEYGIPPYFSMFINVSAELPGFFLAIIMIDKQIFGRLWTLRFFSFCSIISIMLTIFLQSKVAISVLAVVTYFSMVPIFSILEAYTPECYPTSLRSTVMSLVNIAMAIPGMATAFIGARILLYHDHWLYPLVWGTVFAAQFIITLTLRKETLHNPLEEKPDACYRHDQLSREGITNDDYLDYSVEGSG